MPLGTPLAEVPRNGARNAQPAPSSTRAERPSERIGTGLPGESQTRGVCTEAPPGSTPTFEDVDDEAPW